VPLQEQMWRLSLLGISVSGNTKGIGVVNVLKCDVLLMKGNIVKYNRQL
jgi:hypothetical protein